MIENDPISLIICDFSEENRCTIEFIRHALLGQSFFWPALTYQFNAEQIITKFRPLLYSKPPLQYNYAECIPHPTYFRLNIFNFINSITHNEKMDVLPYYLLELKLIGKNWSDILFPLLASPIILQEKQYKTALDSLSSFHDKNPALLRALNPCIARLLKQIGAKNFIPAFGFDSFAIVEKLDTSFLEYFPQNTINHSNIADFLSFHTFLTNENISKVFQSLFACGEPFPSQSKLFKENHIMTLTNDSICKKKHFFDILFTKALGCLVSESTAKFQTITENFPELRKWIILSQYETIYQDNTPYFEELYETFYFEEPSEDNVSSSSSGNKLSAALNTLNINLKNLTTGEKQSSSEKIDVDDKTCLFFERLRNDKTVISRIKMLLGVKLSKEDFVQKSLPLILLPLINDENIVNDELFDFILSNVMFIISDEQKIKDVSFFFAYRMFSSMLTERTTEEGTKFNINCALISKYLEQIPDESMIQSIVLDLFSLLFISEINYELSECQNLIAVIIPYCSKAILPHLSICMTKMQISSHLGITKFKDCLFSAENYFLFCIKRKEYKLAEKIIASDKKLVTLSKVAQQMYNYSQHADIEISEDIKALFEIEKFFSFDDENEKQEKIKLLMSDGKRELLEVAKKRCHKSLSCVENSENFFSLAQTVDKAIDDKNITIVPNNLVQTRNFVAFLKLYKTEHNESIVDLVTDINDEESLCALLGPNSIEKLLQSNNGDKIHTLLENHYPLVAKCLELEKSLSQKKDYQGETKDGILYAIDHSVVRNDISDYLMECVIECDIDKIIDMRLMYDETDEILRNIKTDLSMYIQIFPEESNALLEKCAELGITAIDPAEIIAALFEKQEISLAKQVSDFYNLQSIFVEGIMKRQKENKEFIVSCCPINSILIHQLFDLLPNDMKTLELKQKVYGFDLNNKQNVREIARLHSNINFDDELYEYILSQEKEKEKIRKTNSTLQIFKSEYEEICWVSSLIDVIPLFKTTKRICSFLCTNLVNQISKLHIFNQTEEEETIFILRKAKDVLQSIKNSAQITDSFIYEPNLSKVDALVRVFSNYLFTRFSLTFNLSHFQENIFGELLINVCSNVDIDVISDINTSWRCDPSIALLKKCEYAFIMGDNKYCWDIIHKQKVFGGKLTRDELADVIKDLSFPILFNIKQKEKVTSDDQTHQTIPSTDAVTEVSVDLPHEIIKTVLLGEGIETSYKEQALVLTDLVEAFCGLHEHAAFCCSCSMIQSAFESWSKIPPSQRTAQFAIKDIVYPVMAAGKNAWTKFLKTLANDPQCQKDFPLDGVVEILRQRRMFFALSTLFYQLQQYEASALSRITVLQQRDSWRGKLEDSKFIVDCFMKEANQRQELKKNQRIITDEDLMKYSVIAGLECSFVQMCIDEKVKFLKVDLFSNRVNDALVMATVAFVKSRFNLCLGICDLYTDKTSKNESNSLLTLVAQNAIDSINEHGKKPENIPLFLEHLKKKVDEKSYKRIVFPFVKCVFSRAADLSTVLKFIKAHVKGIQFQIELMMDLDFCDEALDLAVRKGTKDDMILIECLAKEKGKDQLLVKIHQVLAMRK